MTVQDVAKNHFCSIKPFFLFVSIFTLSAFSEIRKKNKLKTATVKDLNRCTTIPVPKFAAKIRVKG